MPLLGTAGLAAVGVPEATIAETRSTIARVVTEFEADGGGDGGGIARATELSVRRMVMESMMMGGRL